MSTTETITNTTSGIPRITEEQILRLFPDLNTSLATATRAGASSELEGYDEEQVRLMDEVCIVLDSDDKPIGSASKKDCASFPLPRRDGRNRAN